MKTLFRKLFRQDVYESIHYDDLLSRQQYALFRIFSWIAFLASLAIAAQIHFAFASAMWLDAGMLALGLVMIANFYLASNLHKLPLHYFISLFSAFLIIHIQSYTTGGIRNSGTMYIAVIILCAFMMLGSKAGKWFAGLTIAHFVYLFCITEYTSWTSTALFQDDIHLINQDFLSTAILSFILLSSQSNYLHSGKNVIIERITEQRNQLEISNQKLQEYTTHLEKTNRELDKFASIVSHDLKAPLRAIGNLTDWIEEDGAASFNPETRTHFNTIKQRVKRMEDLIQAILDYSKADRRTGDEVQVDTRQLVNDSVEFIGIPANVKIHIGTQMPVFVTDKTRLQQVLANLIGNAVKYNDKDTPEITVTAEERRNEGWTFSVKDNGPGIDKQFHEKIFVIFQTLNRRDAMESTGVGLAIVKKIVEDQGGNIWVESEPGKGADFKFFWPKVKKEKDAALRAA